MAKDTKTDALLRRIKNNRWLSYLIVLSIVILSTITLAEGLNKAGKIIENIYISARRIARYDDDILKSTIEVAYNVDCFWGSLLDKESSERSFVGYQSVYTEIETDMRILLMRNKIRSMNEYSVLGIEITLDSWIEDRQLHEADNTIEDSIAQSRRELYQQLFTAIALGEAIKKDNKLKDVDLGE